MRIVNAGSEGVRLRPEPGAEEILRVLPDGALLVALGEERDDGGRVWRRVRDDEATEGWVAADFLAAVPVTPTVTAAAAARPTVTIVAAAPPPTQPPPPTPPPPTARVAPTQPPPTQPPATQVPAAATQAPPPPTPRATVPAPAPKPQPAPPATAVSKPTAAVPVSAPTAPASAGQGRPSGMDCPSGQPIKGNHASSGEWIYHLPRGQYYSRTRPEACFATEADASRAGYRPSQR